MKERGIVQKLQELGDKEKEDRRQKGKEDKEETSEGLQERLNTYNLH